MRRALHYVFKIGDRNASYKFYTEILGMKVLRHEEFNEACKAACNGPYDGKWSKTMIGYGSEDSHFVLELTYNYGIGSYKLGNDFHAIWINSRDAIERVKSSKIEFVNEDSFLVVKDPDGHCFYLKDDISKSGDPICKVSVHVSDLKKSTGYWRDLCQMQSVEAQSDRSVISYSPDQCQLELRLCKTSIDRGSAFGRIAFSAPSAMLSQIEADMREADQTILTPLISLDTPGKSTVQVVILADPDDHEICFVGDEAFRELSQLDPEADHLLKNAISKDKSSEWFKKHGGKTIG